MQAAEADTRNMKPLVALVIIMGVLIVAGLVVVVVTIVNRMGGGGRSVEARTAAEFATADLPVPAGCQVVETTTADDRLVLRLGSGERCNQVLIVDMATGKLLGTLRLVPNGQ
jgi:Family of unknown function (DUF6476)